MLKNVETMAKLQLTKRKFNISEVEGDAEEHGRIDY